MISITIQLGGIISAAWDHWHPSWLSVSAGVLCKRENNAWGNLPSNTGNPYSWLFLAGKLEVTRVIFSHTRDQQFQTNKTFFAVSFPLCIFSLNNMYKLSHHLVCFYFNHNYVILSPCVSTLLCNTYAINWQHFLTSSSRKSRKKFSPMLIINDIYNSSLLYDYYYPEWCYSRRTGAGLARLVPVHAPCGGGGVAALWAARGGPHRVCVLYKSRAEDGVQEGGRKAGGGSERAQSGEEEEQQHQSAQPASPPRPHGVKPVFT